MSRLSDRAALITIVVIATLIRLALMVALSAYEIDNNWEFGYETGQVAASLAEGRGFESPFVEPTGATAWLSPVYPLLLAAVFKVAGVYSLESAVLALSVNSLLSALTCVPLFYVARTIFDRSAAIAAAAIYAVYPPAIWHAITTIWDTTLLVFLIVMMLWWLLRLPDRIDGRTSILFGGFLGLIVLVSPVILAVYPLLLLWLYVHPAVRTRARTRSLLTVCGVAFLTVLPWVGRNYLVFGRPMLRSNFGLELWLENNARSWQALQEDPDISAVDLGHPSLDESEFDRYRELGEIAYVNQSYQQAADWIREHPGRFLRLTVKRIGQFWFGRWSGIGDWSANLKTDFDMTWVKRMCHVLPLPFLLGGIVLSLRRRLPVWPLLAVLVMLPAVYYITHVAQRYRQPIEPVIVLFTGYALSQLWHRVFAKAGT